MQHKCTSVAQIFPHIRVYPHPKTSIFNRPCIEVLNSGLCPDQVQIANLKSPDFPSWYWIIVMVCIAMCDGTQNVKQYRYWYFFRYQIFSIPIQVLFSIPNFSHTCSETKPQKKSKFPVPFGYTHWCLGCDFCDNFCTSQFFMPTLAQWTMNSWQQPFQL